MAAIFYKLVLPPSNLVRDSVLHKFCAEERSIPYRRDYAEDAGDI